MGMMIFSEPLTAVALAEWLLEQGDATIHIDGEGPIRSVWVRRAKRPGELNRVYLSDMLIGIENERD